MVVAGGSFSVGCRLHFLGNWSLRRRAGCLGILRIARRTSNISRGVSNVFKIFPRVYIGLAFSSVSVVTLFMSPGLLTAKGFTLL